MFMRLSITAALLHGLFGLCSADEQETGNFTIVNGQIYTPGLAIIDSPQPFTPEGGDFLQVAIDVSGDGRLPLPPYDHNTDTGIYNLTLFLTSLTTGLNLTISNGTDAGWVKNSIEPPQFGCNNSTISGFENAGCQAVMLQESGSTVKHVNWVWPDCLVGDGGGSNSKCSKSGASLQDCLNGNARGPYNISIHQSFRMNNTQYYTIFDLPINVTNSISSTTQQSSSHARPLCALRKNPILPADQLNSSTTPLPYQPYLGGNVSVSGSNSGSGDGSGNGSGTGSGNGSGNPSNTNAGRRTFQVAINPVSGLIVLMLATTLIS